MITPAEAEEIAAGWARQETARLGYVCTPMLAEFDLGYVVWTRPPESVTPIPGDGGRYVIDRATGLLTTWPAVPTETLAELYRERRPELATRRRTLDPAVELLRNARRRPSPTTAAHLTVGGRVFLARGAKGDQEIDHHPLVAQHLSTMDRGKLVRGCERHAELIALSDALHATSPATLGDARDLLRTSEFEAFFIREPGDPMAGQPARPCESCIRALVDFAVLPWPDLARSEGYPAPLDDRVAQPGRFPDVIARTLAGAGWHPMHEVSREALADSKIKDLEEYGHRAFPAAHKAIADFPVLVTERGISGVRRAIRSVHLSLVELTHTAGVLAELATVIGEKLFPIGMEHWGDTVLAIDERGRVFGLDQGGEWFLGETFDETLINLLIGDGPAERIRDDGTW